MDKTKMVRVIVDGKEYSYPAGTSYRALAADFQDRYEYDILLADRDNKLCELHKTLDRDCTLRFITAADKPGKQTYERGVCHAQGLLRHGGPRAD